jgi:hypothetical protein
MLSHHTLAIFFGFSDFQLVKVYALLYTDPGSGALIWQLIVAAFLGFMFYVRFFVHRVREKFSAKKKKGPPSEVSLSSEYESRKSE